MLVQIETRSKQMQFRVWGKIDGVEFDKTFQNVRMASRTADDRAPIPRRNSWDGFGMKLLTDQLKAKLIHNKSMRVRQTISRW